MKLHVFHISIMQRQRMKGKVCCNGEVKYEQSGRERVKERKVSCEMNRRNQPSSLFCFSCQFSTINRTVYIARTCRTSFSLSSLSLDEFTEQKKLLSLYCLHIFVFTNKNDEDDRTKSTSRRYHHCVIIYYHCVISYSLSFFPLSISLLLIPLIVFANLLNLI